MLTFVHHYARLAIGFSSHRQPKWSIYAVIRVRAIRLKHTPFTDGANLPSMRNPTRGGPHCCAAIFDSVGITRLPSKAQQ